jgi:signal transduction histidine kinase
VHVVHHLDDEIPDVPADPNQLRRVFGNLIDNAVEAMPDGGQLTIVTAPKGDDAVAISITDTGEGISRANQAKIFEPLFTTKTEGIGLGLAMADSLIRGHGGTITVKSEEGEGSTFTVVLPIEQGG